MKHNTIAVYLFFLFIMLFASCGEQVRQENEKPAGNGEPPRIVFEETEYDFGRVSEGEKVGWYFTFRNEGGSDLIITNARASCGCTVPEYSREPVPPGGEGKVKVIYDSSGRGGKEIKTVTIESNAINNVSRLNLKVEVTE